MKDKIELKHIFLPPNLMSIARIILAPIIILIMMSDFQYADRYALLVLFIAGWTDFFDGYLARKFNQVTKLGLILDPLADKLLAILLIVGLVVIRDFPIWLVALVIGRDLLIVLAGLFVMGKQDAVPASDIIGKNYFGALAFLLGSYVVSFQFGIELWMIITLVFFALSTINYGVAFLNFIKRGRPDYLFKGRVVVYIVNILTLIVMPIFFYKLIVYLFF